MNIEEYDKWKEEVSTLSFTKNFKGMLEYVKEESFDIFNATFSRASVSNWQAGKYLPNFNSISQMLEIFGFDSVYDIFPLYKPSSLCDREWRQAVHNNDISTIVDKLEPGQSITVEKVECHHCSGKGFKTQIRASE